ncbi:MAG: phage portal protein, partial [Actinomycetota bacterium]
PNIDMEGRATGEVEPYIEVISRMNQTVLDRHLVERFGAWVVRWATGLELPTKTNEEGEEEEDQEAKQALKMKMSIEDILISENPDAKFGTLSATDMEPYVNAEEWQARNLAVISRSTPSQFVGQVENLSADAIAALNAPHLGKVARHKTNLGEQAERMFRLVARYQDRTIDHSSQALWRNSEFRSLAQLADGLSKLVSDLKIPPDQFWPFVAQSLGRPQQDVEQWRRAARDTDRLGELLANLVDEGME